MARFVIGASASNARIVTIKKGGVVTKEKLLEELTRIANDAKQNKLTEARLKIIADKEDANNFFVDLDYLGK